MGGFYQQICGKKRNRAVCDAEKGMVCRKEGWYQESFGKISEEMSSRDGAAPVGKRLDLSSTVQVKTLISHHPHM